MFIPEPTRVSINHPMADEISIIDHEWASCVPGVSSEIAFFVRDEWVTTPLPEFAEYSEQPLGTTLVYGGVPNDLLNEFLDKYRA